MTYSCFLDGPRSTFDSPSSLVDSSTSFPRVSREITVNISLRLNVSIRRRQTTTYNTCSIMKLLSWRVSLTQPFENLVKSPSKINWNVAWIFTIDPWLSQCGTIREWERISLSENLIFFFHERHVLVWTLGFLYVKTFWIIKIMCHREVSRF